ncbi:MAG: glutamate 5-kinase [Candidatus Omnitrophica bacterium]|nr:glutamate 5-kinase [Candidatus Omnitrophota bacterium]
MKQSGKNYKRIVIKIGSSLLFGPEGAGGVSSYSLRELAGQVAELVKEGREVVIVSSGAIAFGMRILKMKSRPRQLHELQGLAAVGQHVLMEHYHRFFKKKGLHCAQVLLTWDDLANRKRCLNAKNTLLELLRLKVVPIINENDTISSEEIKFGDNDKLSALVASNLVSAELLIILSDVEGLLDRSKKVVRIVDAITPQIRKLACPTNKAACVGGMITKLDAAKIAVDSGIPCVIANGRSKDIILSAVNEPQEAGTFFVPSKSLTERQRWLAFGSRPKGKVYVDEGARRALVDKKSLLSVGVVNREGNFERGDIVSLIDSQGKEFARGKAGVSSKHLDKVKGRRSEKEVIHCDNIVIL